MEQRVTQRRDHVQRMRQLRQQEQQLISSYRPLPPHLFQQPSSPLQHSLQSQSRVQGFVNLGNTCYLNSVLECLRHSRPLIEYLLGEGFLRDRLCFINRKPLEQAFMTEFRSLIAKVDSAEHAVRPSDLLKLLIMFNPSFGGGVQADAQECLTTILQSLHVALRLNVRITIDSGSGDSHPFEQMRRGFKQYESHLKHDGYSPLDEIFGSQFESRLTCNRCGHVWASFDPYSLVPVEIAARALTLYDCLDQFMALEHMDDVECERCSREHGKTKVTKQFRLWTLPKMLVIQLKRFDPMMRKINQFIQAPRILNLTSYISHPRVLGQIDANPNALQLYHLKGIVCHSGQLQGGHYTAKCYREDDSCWYDFNDDRVSVIPENVVDQALQSPLNYILFYEMSPETKIYWKKK
jgi:ubiquitin carboxyl-terminal hydrolase 2